MKFPEQYRTDGLINESGYFLVPFRSFEFLVIATLEHEWDHVSVSLNNRCPSWNDMCFIKDLFWDEEECVVQYHPPKRAHICNHTYCLHMWKPQFLEIPTPPGILVGIKELGVLV